MDFSIYIGFVPTKVQNATQLFIQWPDMIEICMISFPPNLTLLHTAHFGGAIDSQMRIQTRQHQPC